MHKPLADITNALPENNRIQLVDYWKAVWFSQRPYNNRNAAGLKPSFAGSLVPFGVLAVMMISGLNVWPSWWFAWRYRWLFSPPFHRPRHHTPSLGGVGNRRSRTFLKFSHPCFWISLRLPFSSYSLFISKNFPSKFVSIPKFFLI